MLTRHLTSKFRFNRQTKALASSLPLCHLLHSQVNETSEKLTATQETREVTWKHVEHYYDSVLYVFTGVYCELCHCYLLNAYGALLTWTINIWASYQAQHCSLTPKQLRNPYSL